MDPVDLCSKWNCDMVRLIPEAHQIVVSEFIDSRGPTVHTFRLVPEAYAAVAGERGVLEHTARYLEYSAVKKFIRERAESGSGLGVPESAIRFKTVKPSQWFMHHCQDEAPKPTDAGHFASEWAAWFGTIAVPEFRFGENIRQAYRECHDSLNSCMTGVGRSEFTRIYGTSKRCCLAVVRDDNGNIIERALMFLPDCFPEDMPPGEGWCVGRIYPGDTPLHRARMGPWCRHNKVRWLRSVDESLVVSGFSLCDDLYLPYLDIGQFRFGACPEAGDQCEWVLNPTERGRYLYPGNLGSNCYEGGPLREDRYYCRRCECAINEDERNFPDDGDPMCEDCLYEEFAYCDITGGHVRHDYMLRVIDCLSHDSVSRDAEYFVSRGIHYSIVELADGEMVYVPDSDIVCGRYRPDMEENDWLLRPTLYFDSMFRFLLSGFHEDDFEWISPEDYDPGTKYEVFLHDRFIEAVANSRNYWTTSALQVIRDAGLTMTAGPDRVLSLHGSDGTEYELIPIIASGSTLSIYDRSTGNYVDVVPDPRNRDHRERLGRHMVNGFVINPKTAATAETASNQ